MLWDLRTGLEVPELAWKSRCLQTSFYGSHPSQPQPCPHRYLILSPRNSLGKAIPGSTPELLATCVAAAQHTACGCSASGWLHDTSHPTSYSSNRSADQFGSWNGRSTHQQEEGMKRQICTRFPCSLMKVAAPTELHRRFCVQCNKAVNHV